MVANIDADTLVPPGWLDRVLAEFDRSPRLVVLSGPYDYYDVPTLTPRRGSPVGKVRPAVPSMRP